MTRNEEKASYGASKVMRRKLDVLDDGRRHTFQATYVRPGVARLFQGQSCYTVNGNTVQYELLTDIYLNGKLAVDHVWVHCDELLKYNHGARIEFTAIVYAYRKVGRFHEYGLRDLADIKPVTIQLTSQSLQEK
jgi:hypothetical protein